MLRILINSATLINLEIGYVLIELISVFRSELINILEFIDYKLRVVSLNLYINYGIYWGQEGFKTKPQP